MLHLIVGQGSARPGTGIDPADLRQFAASYEPAAVAAKTGVSAKAIERMAQDFAQANGALALPGSDDAAAHVAVWMLNAVTGNIGKTVN